MATPSEKLAESLNILHELQEQDKRIIRSSDLTKTHRTRLVNAKYLRKVTDGWYIPSSPYETVGETTSWMMAFWDFCATYLQSVRGNEWCLSAEQSISLHAGNWQVPQQLLVKAINTSKAPIELLHDTSLLCVGTKSLPKGHQVVVRNELRLYALPYALIACHPNYFIQNSTDITTVLATISEDASEVLEPLLEGQHSTIAGRLAGALRHIGRDSVADAIGSTMHMAGYQVREQNPFAKLPRIALSGREKSPYITRIRLMWHNMRDVILKSFPSPSNTFSNIQDCLDAITEIYVTDAYHSLSIEGYQVTPALIQKVQGGNWQPDTHTQDREAANALAAHGYWQAFQAVKESVAKVMQSDASAGQVVNKDHHIWYREMFAPSIIAGLAKPADLAGYRNQPVYIRNARHTPPNCEAVRDTMPVLFQLLTEEQNAAVRAVLGHFIFVYIHPYMDGNGRMGRFLMNVMFTSGGYPWVVVPLDKRSVYMDALEAASVNQDITFFTDFLAGLMQAHMKKQNNQLL